MCCQTAKKMNWGKRRNEGPEGERDLNNGEMETMGQPEGPERGAEGKMSHITAPNRALIEMPLQLLYLDFNFGWPKLDFNSPYH